MKKILSLTITFILLTSLSVFSAEQRKDSKVAVVNIRQIVAESSQVKAIKKEYQANIKALEKFIKKAEKDINSQTSDELKREAAQKYAQELAQKKEAGIKEYRAKAAQAEKDITNAIIKKAQEMGYDIVLNKDIVQYGENDITKDISKAIK